MTKTRRHAHALLAVACPLLVLCSACGTQISPRPAAPSVAPGRVGSDPLSFELVWEVAGSWSGVAVDPSSGDVYAMSQGLGAGERWVAHVCRFDRSGRKLGSVDIQGGVREMAPQSLRIAHLKGAGVPDLVTIAEFEKGAAIHAFDAQGFALWQCSAGAFVNDVSVADLDHDGRDEVIVGTTDGVQVLNADGSRKWASKDTSWVWSVTAITADADRPSLIVAAKSGRNLLVLDSAGIAQQPIRSAMEPLLVRASSIPGRPPAVVEATNSPLQLCAQTLSGEELWKVTDADESKWYFDDMTVAPDRPWVALHSFRQGRIVVYDLRDGVRLAAMRVGGRHRCAWVPGGNDARQPLLVVADSGHLKAFALRPTLEHQDSVPKRSKEAK